MAKPDLPTIDREQFDAALGKIESSQRAAALRLFDVDDRTARRWIAGDLPIPRSVTVALAVMIKHKVSAAEAIEIADAFAASFAKGRRK